MRAILAAAICCLVAASPASGEQVFPYKAFVTTNDVYLRSGPGQSYYPTDKLKAGQEIEVYRHDPGGWHAVRPIKGSFSWVSDRYLQGGKDDLAIVTADGVACRVGSRFSDIRDVIQIRLHKGEVVEVLNSVKVGSRKWYKITPPSGEFRWIAGKYVDADYPKDGIRKTGTKGERAGQTEPADTATQGKAVAQEQTPTDKPANDSAPVEPAAFVRQPPDQQPARSSISVNSDPISESVPTPPRVVVLNGGASGKNDGQSPVARAMTPEQFQAELEDLDLKLSTMVAEEPTVWSFDAMRQGAREMFNLAETAVERGRARMLMNRLANFADVKRRYSEMVAMQEKVERAGHKLAAIKQSEDRATPLPDPLDDRFDGVGQLTRVVSPNAGAPRFALVDRHGEVRCYVSPVPGVNLGHYLGHRIGVTGNRGYMPQQRAHHVMARHVNLLEGEIR